MRMSVKQSIKKLIMVYGYGEMVISELECQDLIKPQCVPRWFLSELEHALLELSSNLYVRKEFSNKSGFVFEGYDYYIHAVSFHHFRAVHIKWTLLDHIPKCVCAPGLEDLLKKHYPSDNG